MEITLTPALISAIVAFVLSFLVENVEVFKTWWATFKHKELVVAASGIVVCGVLVGLSYAGAPIIGVPKPFIWDGLMTMLSMMIAYLTSSQTAYQLQASKLPRKQ